MIIILFCCSNQMKNLNWNHVKVHHICENVVMWLNTIIQITDHAKINEALCST